jgi:hypothetical protein
VRGYEKAWDIGMSWEGNRQVGGESEGKGTVTGFVLGVRGPRESRPELGVSDVGAVATPLPK